MSRTQHRQIAGFLAGVAACRRRPRDRRRPRRHGATFRYTKVWQELGDGKRAARQDRRDERGHRHAASNTLSWDGPPCDCGGLVIPPDKASAQRQQRAARNRHCALAGRHPTARRGVEQRTHPCRPQGAGSTAETRDVRERSSALGAEGTQEQVRPGGRRRWLAADLTPPPQASLMLTQYRHPWARTLTIAPQVRQTGHEGPERWHGSVDPPSFCVSESAVWLNAHA